MMINPEATSFQAAPAVLSTSSHGAAINQSPNNRLMKRSRDLCHGADRDRDNKCSDKMIAIGYHSIGAENETRDHKPSTDTAASKQGPGNGDAACRSKEPRCGD